MKEEYKTALVSGGMSGGVCLLYFLVFYLSGINLFDPIMKYDVWIPTIGILLAIFYYRNGIGDSGLKFLQGIWMGLMVVSVVIVCMSIFLFLILDVLDTNYVLESIQGLEKQLQEGIASGKALKVSPEELETYISELKKDTSSLSFIKDKSIRYILFGFPATIVASVLFRK